MAGRIREDDIAEVREKARIDDVVSGYVTLRNAGGGSMKGLCPFHDEKSPSFHVTPARQFWHCLAGENQRDRLMAQRRDHAPDFDGLVGVGGPERDESGDRAQRRQLLDRLVRRAVFADADRIVREDVDDRNLHQRTQPDRRAGIVTEDQEARSERAYLGQREAIEHGGHGVLTDPEVEIASGRILGAEVPGAVRGQPCLARRTKICRAANHPGHIGGDGIQRLARRITRGEPCAVWWEHRQALTPVVGKLALQHAIALVGELGIRAPVFLELRPPRLMLRRAACADPGLEVLTHAVGDQKLRVFGPPVMTLGEPDLVLAERLAVSGTRILFVRCAVGDVAVHDDQRGSIGRSLERVERTLEHREIVGVPDTRDIPSVPDEASGDVIAVAQRGVAFDGDVIVVVDPAQVGQLQVSGQ